MSFLLLDINEVEQKKPLLIQKFPDEIKKARKKEKKRRRTKKKRRKNGRRTEYIYRKKKILLHSTFPT